MARYEKEHRDMMYRIYVTDILKAVAFNTAFTGQTMVVDKRWAEIIMPDIVQNEERTSDDIISDIRKKLEG